VDAVSPKDAIRLKPVRRWVVRKGKVIAESEKCQKLF